MGRSKIGLHFKGWEEVIAKLDKLAGTESVKCGVESALKSSKKYVTYQIEKSLESIIKAICDEKVNKKDLNKYISYIVNSIPSPPYHSKILFPLAYNNKLAIIQYPYFKDLNKSMDNPLIILDYINEENILILFKLLNFINKLCPTLFKLNYHSK